MNEKFAVLSAIHDELSTGRRIDLWSLKRRTRSLARLKSSMPYAILCSQVSKLTDADRKRVERAFADVQRQFAGQPSAVIVHETWKQRPAGSVGRYSDGVRNEWSPPDGHVGTKTIMRDARFRKAGKNPPRTTIDVWVSAAKKRGDVPEIQKDPATGEVHLPERWIFDRIAEWNPRQCKRGT